jgi:hypothetical protein
MNVKVFVVFACLQIDEVLQDDEKSEAIVSHVDQLLITCTLQLRVTYSKHMSIHLDGSARGVNAQHDVLRLYKCLLATLLSVSCAYALLHFVFVLYSFVVLLNDMIYVQKNNQLKNGFLKIHHN